MRKLIVLMVLVVLAASSAKSFADGFGLDLSPNGEFKAAGADLALNIRTASVQKSCADMAVDAGYPKQSGDSWETRGSIDTGSGNMLHVAQTVQRVDPLTYSVTYTFNSDQPINTQWLAVVAKLPVAEYSGKAVDYNGGPVQLPATLGGTVVTDSWKSNISTLDLPSPSGKLQFKGSINSCIMDSRTWGGSDFDLRFLPTPWTGTLSQSSLSFTIVLPQSETTGATAVAPSPSVPSAGVQLTHEDNGSFSFNSVKFGLLLQGSGFAKGSGDVQVSPGYPQQRGNAWVTDGQMSLANGGSAHLTEQITQSDGKYNISLKLSSPTATQADTVALVGELPTAFYAGKSISYNGGPVALPVGVGGAMLSDHWKGGISTIDIPLQSGSLRLSGTLNSGVADERNWGAQSFGLRLAFVRSPSSPAGFTEADLQFSISASGVQSSDAGGAGAPLQLIQGGVPLPIDLSKWHVPPPWAVESKVVPEDSGENNCFKFVRYRANWGYQPTKLVLYPRVIARVVFLGRIKTSNVVAGIKPFMKAQAALQFLDDQGEMVGTWPGSTDVDGTTDWTPFRQDLTCPEGTRVVNVILGMLVSTGTAFYDNLQIAAYDSSGNIVSPTPTPTHVSTDTSGWWKFAPGVEDTSRPLVVDLSKYIPAPAGKFGHVTVMGGHFAFSNGQRVRFWGSGAANWCPAKSDSDRIARNLVQDGVNLVRFHGMDAQDRSRSIFDPSSDKTDRLDPVKLDLMDYHFANLKKHGVYVDLNLLTKRRYLPGDGVVDCDNLPEGGKCAALFDPRLIALQKDYDRLLLNHVNPYTGLAYKDDPGVAVVEIINETSLFSLGLMGGIPQYYMNELSDRFKSWCSANGVNEPSQPIAVLLDKRTPEAVRFAQSIESAYYADMYGYLKNDIGVKSLITGTSYASEVDEKRIQSSLDFVDAHAYNDAPSDGYDPTDDFTDHSIVKTPNNIICQLAAESVEGKPFTISEWNDVWSNQFITEGPFIMAACAGFQDWDAPMVFTVSGTGWQDALNDCFINDSKPQFMVPFVTSALSFYRGDVQPGPENVVSVDNASTGSNTTDLYGLSSPSTYTTLLSHRDRVRIGGATAQLRNVAASTEEPSLQTSQEIRWDTDRGVFILDAPSEQGVVGFTGGLPVQTTDATIRLTNPFGQVIVTSLTGSPIKKSKDLLITATANAENTDETYHLFYKGLTNVGHAPILIEPVNAQVTLNALNGVSPTVYVLDWYGRRTAQTVPVIRRSQNSVEVDLGSQPGCWFEVRYP